MKSVLIAAVMLIAAALNLAHANNAEVPELPLEAFFKHSLYENVKISPDGKHLAVTMRKDDTVGLAIVNRKKNKITANYSFGKFRPILNFHWANNKRVLMEVRKVVGNLDNKGGPAHLYAANVNGKKKRELFQPYNSQYRMLDLLPHDEDNILIVKYHYSDKGAGVIRMMDVNTGKLKKIIGKIDKEVASSAINRFGEIKAITKYEVDEEDESLGETTFFYRTSESKPWSELKLPGLDKTESVNILGLSSDEKIVYFSGDFETPTLALYKLELSTGNYEQVFVDSDVDIQSLIYAYDNSIIGVRYVPDFPEVEIINDEHVESVVYEELGKAFPTSQIYFTSYTEGGTHAVVWITNDRVEGDFYLLDIKKLNLSYLMSGRPWVKEKQMASIDSFKIKARDGLDIYGYLTLPKNKSKNVPTILKVHGGPWGTRDSYEFDQETQFFANRGWAVLQVNFRGSGGYGKAFQNAGKGQWGKAMQDDLLDALNHFTEKGVLNKDKVCIYGASYGGYAALMGVARDPDVFKCAIGYLGVYDIETLLNSGDIAKNDGSRKFVEKFIQIPASEYPSISPARLADKIKVPVLLVHGEDDVRATIDHHEMMVEALEEAGKPYESMVRDEGHGFSKQKNIIDYYTKLEKFLKKHLN